MRRLYCIWTFYKKLVVPVSSISFLTGLLVFLNTGSDSAAVNLGGISYLVFTPVFQYFIYEVRNPHEYYFYYNTGLSRTLLWIAPLTISLFTCLIILMI